MAVALLRRAARSAVPSMYMKLNSNGHVINGTCECRSLAFCFYYLFALWSTLVQSNHGTMEQKHPCYVHISSEREEDGVLLEQTIRHSRVLRPLLKSGAGRELDARVSSAQGYCPRAREVEKATLTAAVI